MEKRKPYSPKSAIGLRAFWAKMLPEERSARARHAARARSLKMTKEDKRKHALVMRAGRN